MTAELSSKVLFVDDEENILRALKRLMMEEPFEVLVSTSGEEALKVLDGDREIGVIVSDQRMPGLAGVDFLERSREYVPEAERIMLTGYADVVAAVEAINKGGAHRYVAKPWNDDELIQIVRDAVRRNRLVKENLLLQEEVKRKNEELSLWNTQLKQRVLERTAEIRKRNEELQRINERFRRNFRSGLAAFSGLIELRDPTMRGHSSNVSDLSARIASAMGLDDREKETIRVAGLLHDVGKIGIPDTVLRKAWEELSPEEREVYMTHPVRGQMAVDSIEDLREAGVLIRHHHERFDGKGFPDGKAVNQIPVGARIIALADFVDRTIGSVPAVAAREFTADRVREVAGKRFDPALTLFLDKPLAEVYGGGRPEGEAVEKELKLEDLRPGMVVSRDVRSGTGVLLFTKRTILDESHIGALARLYRMDPTRRGVFVLMGRRDE
jgi:response regulator RpfG family c-di-GMP phosphodiesterase